MATMFVLLLQLVLVAVVVGFITSCSATIAFGAPDLVPNTSTSTARVCKVTERGALVEFKKHFISNTSRLSSWEGQEDCCSWEGVRCDNQTGNIVQLDLRCPYHGSYKWCLGGEISPSLLRLQHLTHIDFSRNYFYGTSIPSFISQFKELRYLNLSRTYFNGSIPTSFGNLSNLHTLDLTQNFFDTDLSDQYQWLSHLTSLQHFVANGAYFGNSSSSGLFLALNKLPSIKEIRLSHCDLETIPDLSIPDLVNFSSLAILDLSENYINFSGCSSWVFNLKTLEYLDLSYNHLYQEHMNATGPFNYLGSTREIYREYSKISISESIGSLCGLETLHLSGLSIKKRLVELGAIFSGCLMDGLTHLHLSEAHLEGDISDWMGDIKNLKVLDLSGNSLSGSVPSSLARLSSLVELDLSSNELNGTLPMEIGELEELVHLDLSGNKLTGVVSEAHFAELEKLEILYMSGNSLVFNISSNWVPPFLLQGLSIRYCLVGPVGFPTWLRTQHKLNFLDMSYTGITGTIPDWFWNMTTHRLTSVLLLSNNHIEGMLPKSIHMDELDLSSNRFYGPLPEIHSSTVGSNFDLSNNSFSGPIPPSMIDNISDDTYPDIYLSRNQLNGNVPSWLCQTKGLDVIDISENHLSGDLPDCGVNSSAPFNLNLAHNNISGSIPDSTCSDPRVESLQLNHNKLSGEFPLSLKNCSRLIILDLSHNNFIGSIPFWVGKNFSRSVVLQLRSNNFTDQIPQEISQLKYLQILDLSNNNLSKLIPTSLGNLTAMRMPPESIDWIPDILDEREAMPLSFKGRQDDYIDSNLPLVKFINLSNNDLSGLIPEELASLYGLQSLDLSGNQLEGEIPNKLGRLKLLESLDLSRNKLSGSIPSTFSNLTFLSHFNVSHNNLSGRIPSGSQFNTFKDDPSIYVGNHLCGSPLIEKCTQDGGTSRKGPNVQEDEDSEDNETIWLYIGSLSGFAAGFWTVWGVLLFKKKWRHAYFRCTDNIFNNIYVYVIVSFRRMKNKMMPNY